MRILESLVELRRTMKPIEELPDPDPKDNLSLGCLAKMAKEFLQSQPWCSRIRSGFLSHAWEGVLGVFYFELTPSKPDVDERLWVVVGDIPPAYLVCEDPLDPAKALQSYVYEMRRWTQAVVAKQPIDELIPVCYSNSSRPMEPTNEIAEMLAKRLDFVELKLIPDL